MFGFLGTPRCIVEQDAAGYVNGTNRDFTSGHGAKSGYLTARYFFDLANVGSDPNQQALLSTVLVAYDAHPKASLPVNSLGEQTYTIAGLTLNMHSKTLIVNSVRKFRYTSNAALSPKNRKATYELSHWGIEALGFYTDLNTTPTTANNNLEGAASFNLEQFPNLVAFCIMEAFVTQVNLRYNRKIRRIQLRELYNTTVLTPLPSWIEYVELSQVPLTSFNSFLAGATGVKSLLFGSYVGTFTVLTTTISGSLDISHMSLLTEFAIGQNNSLTSILLPVGKSDWEWFHIQNLVPVPSAALPTARLDEVLSSPSLRIFVFIISGKTWARTFVDADFSSNLVQFLIYNNSITGNITLTTAKATLRDFRTGNLTLRTGTQLNSHPIVDITGLTGVRVIDLTGSNVEDLELPVNTVCSTLYLYDNKLDIVTNPNLVSQINAMVALTDLRLSVTTSSAISANNVGQVSTNGLGAVDFSGLSNLQTLNIANCKVTSLIIFNGNALRSLNANFNTSLVSITNLLSVTGLLSLYLHGCTSFTQAITNVFTALRDIRLNNTAMPSIDLSGKTTTAGGFTFIINNNTVITTITLPSTAGASTISTAGGNSFNISGCTALTSVSNLSVITYAVLTGAVNNVLTMDGNSALNITVPLGANNFLPVTILIQNNGMSSANVDATIDSLYTNRAKWNNYSSAKNMNIAGTNGAAGGTYQAPAGFVLGVSDGTPASAKEQLYVLVNNYNWAMTFN